MPKTVYMANALINALLTKAARPCSEYAKSTHRQLRCNSPPSVLDKEILPDPSRPIVARIFPKEPYAGLSSQYILNIAAGRPGKWGRYGRGARSLKLLAEP